MAVFHYRALRPSGGEIAGELTADDERDAGQRLQAIGNYPIEITLPATGAAVSRRITPLRNAVPARERILFTRQLATLLGAGVALDRGLSLIAAAPGSKRRAQLAAELLASINRGESLSAACRAHPALPAHYAMMIGAGEAKGNGNESASLAQAPLEGHHMIGTLAADSDRLDRADGEQRGQPAASSCGSATVRRVRRAY